MKSLFKIQKYKDIFSIENYDDDVQDVLTAPPHWIVRRGIAVIFFVLLVVLAISYFVKYPDIITSEITITSYNTPAELKARSTGRVNLFIKENDFVKKDAIVGYVSNPSVYNDVKVLSEYINNSKSLIENNRIKDLDVPKSLQLGEIGFAFLNHLNANEEYSLFISMDSHSKTLRELNRQIEIYTKLEMQLINQKNITYQELKLAKNKVKVDSVLLKQNVISTLDFERTFSSYLPHEKELQQVSNLLLNNNLRKIELQSRLNEVEFTYAEAKSRLTSKIITTYQALHGELKIWQEKYLLVAPIDGQLTYFKFWNNNQNVEMGETILTIVPAANNMFGYMLMPLAGSGKVSVGQNVNIRLQNYPYNEFGIVKGKVSSISRVPQNNAYAVTVSLPAGLKTSHGIDLNFNEQMKGTGEIITKDYRLIERLFYQLNKIFKNNA